MTENDTPAWLTSYEQITQWQRGASVLRMVTSAHDQGLLATLAEDRTTAAFAQHAGVTTSRAAAVLALFSSYGVVDRVGPDGTWTLTAGWRSLVARETPMNLAGTLALSRVFVDQAGQALADADDYWRLEAGDRLGVALGISPDPAAEATRGMARRLLEPLEGVVPAMEAGGRMLELGCGVASRLTATLLAFPSARAVGVELDAALVEHGRARADALGVGDRLELVCGDATTYEPHGLFDMVSWSQFFFPEPTRASALRVAHGALRAGGWMASPVLWDGTAPDPRSLRDQELAEMRVVLDQWGVPFRTSDEVVAELVDAGFDPVRADPDGDIVLVRGRRP